MRDALFLFQACFSWVCTSLQKWYSALQGVFKPPSTRLRMNPQTFNTTMFTHLTGICSALTLNKVGNRAGMVLALRERVVCYYIHFTGEETDTQKKLNSGK